MYGVTLLPQKNYSSFYYNGEVGTKECAARCDVLNKKTKPNRMFSIYIYFLS